MNLINLVPEIIDKFREGLIVLNDRNEIIFSNKSAKKTLRLPKKNELTPSIDKLFKGSNPELYDFITLSRKAPKYQQPGIINFYHGSSKSKLFVTPFRPHDNGNGKLYYFIFSDATELWNLHKKEMQLLSQLKKTIPTRWTI